MDPLPISGKMSVCLAGRVEVNKPSVSAGRESFAAIVLMLMADLGLRNRGHCRMHALTVFSILQLSTSSSVRRPSMTKLEITSTGIGKMSSFWQNAKNMNTDSRKGFTLPNLLTAISEIAWLFSKMDVMARLCLVL